MDQEEKNQSQSFIKQSVHKGKEAIRKSKKTEQRIKRIIKIMANPLTWKLLAIALIAMIVITLLAGFYKIIDDDKEGNVNGAAASGITTSYTGNASTTETDEEGNTVSKVVVKPNDNETGYEIAYDDTTENIENAKEKIDNETTVSSSEFTDFEIGILDALIDNGADLQYYTEEELHCFPAFIKAESSTQNFDLRPNSEKQSGKTTGDYIDNYEPAKRENLAENEVPGVILVQRTNTNGSKVTLEYKEKEGENGFDALKEANDASIINYFTINDKGNLVIAKWDRLLVTVEGEYPENLDDSEKDVPRDEYIITTEEIPYSQYISKYTMPFEFLVQLLIITTDSDFCMEIVDYVLDSKIIINIQEEQTITVKDETKVYSAYTKENKYINYEVTAVQQQIEKEEDYFLNYAKDDEQNDCTSYVKNDSTVKVHTEYTSNSYSFEIIEADIWYAYYKKDYGYVQQEGPTTTIEDPEPFRGQYQEIEHELEQPITDVNTINTDADVKTFVEEKETNYESKIVVPTVDLTNYTDDDGNNFKKINVTGGTKQGEVLYPEIIDDDGNKTGEYDLPQNITVKSNKVNKTDKTKEIPQFNYIFKLKESRNYVTGKLTYTYELQTDIDPLVECKVTSLNIDRFEKMDLDNYIETSVTKYKASSDSSVTNYIYTKDANGNFVKFLASYDKNPTVKNQLNSIDSWLYEQMEGNEATIELVDIIKYLLYVYDGQDRGVTGIEGFEDLFAPGEFVLSTNGVNISLTTPTLSRENFIKAMQEYNGGTDYDQNFKSRAGEIYDLGIKYGVNPELIVSMAKKEGNFKPAGGQNYWGLDTPNGAAAAYYGTFEEGVERLSEIFKSYMPGAGHANLITQRKNQRSAANCNPNGYGDPGTLKGMLSVYSDLCGSDTKHREGDWGSGGNIYLKQIYGSEFPQRCGNIHKIGIDDYTLQEKSDYTAWLYDNQLKYWTEIFGNYGSISVEGEFLETAKEVWDIVSKTGSGYTYGGSAVPCTKKTIDCSSYVSWVLLEYGYTGFKGPQTNTAGFYHTNWNKKYGWEEIYIDAGENPINQLQPGDIYVRRGSKDGHVCIIVEVKNGKAYGYDCGSAKNWTNKNGDVFDVTWFMNDNRPGKIIRVTPPQN